MVIDDYVNALCAPLEFRDHDGQGNRAPICQTVEPCRPAPSLRSLAGIRLSRDLTVEPGRSPSRSPFSSLGSSTSFGGDRAIQHTPSLWVTPTDIWSSYLAASALVHGHLASVYSSNSGRPSFPGILVALAPLAAFSNRQHTTIIQIAQHHHLVTHPQILTNVGSALLQTEERASGTSQFVFHPQIFLFLGPYMLAMACTALFACDALAERLGVARGRRLILSGAEAVLLWNVVVFWGHPEDALAVALAVYALTFAIDGRFTGAGWLFGVALALQPLVIVLLPILLVMGGKSRALGLAVRTVIPAAAVTVGPLIADAHATLHAVVQQPTFPYNPNNHQTPWTFLAPRVGGKGQNESFGGGPLRIVTLALAASVGWYARRWREKPEMIVWAAVLALALRCYTESVMTAYYCWAPLAVGLVVAARCSRPRFGLAVALSVITTVTAQWHLNLIVWWAIDVAGITGVLVVGARPEPAPAALPPRKALDAPRAAFVQTTKTKRPSQSSRKRTRR